MGVEGKTKRREREVIAPKRARIEPLDRTQGGPPFRGQCNNLKVSKDKCVKMHL